MNLTKKESLVTHGKKEGSNSLALDQALMGRRRKLRLSS
jgi:hypothetical protein